ncbi:hypothetical protein GCM10023085_77860 [Actinomadura viridis]|uniref:Thiamine phosphate synthase YjbQ (UPF0047 family) n=1 Tax=Actinomadura viridis TaxID=58110 RepID=A0A931DMG8_9ACTN|nr:hypothetical protein [Actinomadura viridis]MBG6090311.1 thiamine phosphate synthase YjbQ (UPF0047 family) [Actinomadura viridis]
MNTNVRWTLFAVLLLINVLAGTLLGGTWYQIVIGSLTGAGMLALLIEYLARGRRNG